MENVVRLWKTQNYYDEENESIFGMEHTFISYRTV